MKEFHITKNASILQNIFHYLISPCIIFFASDRLQGLLIYYVNMNVKNWFTHSYSLLPNSAFDFKEIEVNSSINIIHR